MKKQLVLSFFSVALTLALGIGTASAADPQSGKINDSLAQKNLTVAQNLLKSGPGNADEVIKALLKATQNSLVKDPEFSGKMLALAGQYAPQITPPSVPEICAELRRIAASFKPDETKTLLFAAVADTAQKFSKAPVVVSAGRPNECENAFIQIATLSGDEALLAMLPGMRGPGLPPVTIQPGPPKVTPPTEKPSAD